MVVTDSYIQRQKEAVRGSPMSLRLALLLHRTISRGRLSRAPGVRQGPKSQTAECIAAQVWLARARRRVPPQRSALANDPRRLHASDASSGLTENDDSKPCSRSTISVIANGDDWPWYLYKALRAGSTTRQNSSMNALLVVTAHAAQP